MQLQRSFVSNKQPPSRDFDAINKTDQIDPCTQLLGSQLIISSQMFASGLIRDRNDLLREKRCKAQCVPPKPNDSKITTNTDSLRSISSQPETRPAVGFWGKATSWY